MQQFLRKVRVTFNRGALVINPGGYMPNDKQLKVGFNVSKGISGEANTATLELWNLNEGHRNAVGKELDHVMIEAGYTPPGGGSNVGIIFKGNLRDVEHRRDGPDIISKIECGDGDKAFRSATIGKTFPKGTPVKDVVEEIYKELEKKGIDRGEWKFPDDIDSKKFKRPYSICGGCTREMDTLGRGKGFYWSVQNETMEVVPGDGFIGGTWLLTPQTGMIDTPTITDNGVKVSALLNPEARPGRRVQIESQTLEMNSEGGIYRISSATFTGDNRDGDFRVNIQGEAINGGKVDEEETDVTGYIGKTTNLPETVIGAKAQAEREAQWGPIDGEIVDYDAAKGTATVKPLYKPRHNGKPVDMPNLMEIPLEQPRSGSAGLTMPIPAGTKVRLTPMMRSSENYHEEDNGEPSDTRSFALSDMTASLVGGDSLTNPMPNVDPDNVHLRTDPDGNYGFKGNASGKLAMIGSQGDAYALVAEAVDLCAQGFDLLGTEATLDHMAEYASLATQLQTIATKLGAMTLD